MAVLSPASPSSSSNAGRAEPPATSAAPPTHAPPYNPCSPPAVSPSSTTPFPIDPAAGDPAWPRTSAPPSTPARSRRGRLAASTAIAAALTGGLLTVTAASASAAPAGPLPPDEADFNGDGVADLATSAPGANVAGKDSAGQVTVTYGGTTQRHKTFSQNSAGVPGSAEKGDGFGVGHRVRRLRPRRLRRPRGRRARRGRRQRRRRRHRQVLWGSPSGLTGGTTVQDPRPTRHDFFGGPMQAGDFDGDGAIDLAIGARSGAATIDVFNGGISRDSGTSEAATRSPAITAARARARSTCTPGTSTATARTT